MNLIADLHTHTVASTHAYSTVAEMLAETKRLGRKAIAITEHGIAVPDAPHIFCFANIRRQPDFIDGVLFLKGVEANVTDANGSIDMPEKNLKELDWVIASMHLCLLEPLSYEASTKAWLAVAENPLVDMIGHPEQQQYYCDYDAITKAFAKNGKVVELNTGSAFSRPGNENNLKELALCCKKNAVKIAINTDAHSIFDLDRLNSLDSMLEEINFPEDLIINSSMDILLSELRAHNKPVAERAQIYYENKTF